MRARRSDRSRKLAVSETAPVHDPLFLSEADHRLAEKRRQIIQVLPPRPRAVDLEAAAKAFGVSVRQLNRYRSGFKKTGQITSLLPRRRSGGRGKVRKVKEHAVFADVLKAWDRDRPESPASALIKEVRRAQRKQGLKAVCYNTVGNWLAAVPERARVTQKYGAKIAREKFEPIRGKTPDTSFPLQRIQIDHTLVDIVCSDNNDRHPVGRPWYTTAIDEYSRANLGFVLTWNYPSASTVAFLLTRIMLPKDEWLREIGCEGDWPMYGPPNELYTDNAAEFHSRALAAGCFEWGIRQSFRQKGFAHFGGIIERYMRTEMDELKLLPGATARSRWYGRKATMDPNEKAVMTRRELECWLAEHITGEYHKRPHSTTRQRPDLRWMRGIEGTADKPGIGQQPIISNRKKLFLDFSDFETRTIQRYGVSIRNLRYWSEELRPFLDANDKREFVIRRASWDGNRAYLKHPVTGAYHELRLTDPDVPPGTVEELEHYMRLKRGTADSSDDDARDASRDRRDAIVAGAVKTKKAKTNRRKADKRLDDAAMMAELERGEVSELPPEPATNSPISRDIFAPAQRKPLRIEE